MITVSISGASIAATTIWAREVSIKTLDLIIGLNSFCRNSQFSVFFFFPFALCVFSFSPLFSLLSVVLPKIMDAPVNEDALASRVRDLVITRKANACPMVLRLAWHASGTFNKADGSGGRYAQEEHRRNSRREGSGTR